MKKLVLPKFTAETSLNKTIRQYQLNGLTKLQQEIIPQLKFIHWGRCNPFCICIVDSSSYLPDCPCCDSIDLKVLSSYRY
jgi:hypothetical protein